MHTYSEILVQSIAVQSATKSSKTFSTQWWGVSITLHPIVVALEIGPKDGNVIIVRNIQSDE
jgi:hypothetical protein